MEDLHNALEAHFQSLHGQRGASWLIEHPLNSAEREAAQGAVRAALQARGLDTSAWWRLRCLPLLVEATEVGYAYRGPGDGYWPALNEALGFRFGYEERRSLSEHFRAYAAITTTVPANPWSAHFRHIAWPITHALIPRCAQSELFRAIVDHPGLLTLAADPSGAVAALEEHHRLRHPKSRLLPLLAQRDVAASIIGALLRTLVEAERVRPETIARFVADIRASDGLALLRAARKRVIRDERSITIAGPKRRRGTTKKQVEPPARLEGTLRLYADGDRWSFEVIPPPLPEDLAGQVGSRAFRPLGTGRPTPLSNLARGRAFPLTLTALPADEDRLVPAAEELIADRQAAMRLASMYLQVRRPLLFAPLDEPVSVARQVKTRRLFGEGPWLIVGEATALPPIGREVGEVAGLSIVELSGPIDGELRDWCGAHELAIVERGVVEVFGPPEASTGDETSGWPVGAPVLVRLRDMVGGARLTLGRASLEVDGHALVELAGERVGRHPLTIEWSGVEETVELVWSAPEEPAPLVEVELIGAEHTLDALRSRSLGVAMRSDVPLAGLSAVIRLTGGGSTWTRAVFDLPPLPCLLGADHPTLKALWDEVADAGVERWASAEVSVEVSGFAIASWSLEESPACAHWVEEVDGSWRAEGEERGWEVGWSPLATPWRVETGDGVKPSDVSWGLLVPLDDAGEPLVDGGLCVGPRSTQLSEIARPRRLLRSVERDASGAANARELARAWLMWRLGSNWALLGELIRRSVAGSLEACLVEVLCGDQWAKTESTLTHALATPRWETSIAQVLRAQGVASDHDFEDELRARVGAEGVSGVIERALARLVSAERPLFQAIVQGELDDELAESLDRGLGEVLCETWHELFPSDPPEPDFGNDAGTWERAVKEGARQWERRARLNDLRRLCRPPADIEVFVALDYTALTDDEVVAKLISWHGDRRIASALFTGPGTVRPWPASVVEDLYDLWQRPQKAAARRTWPESLRVALGSQFGCRVIRYAVMRRRAALGGEGLS